MAKNHKSDVDAAIALGNACDAAVDRYIKARTPRNARELQRAIAVIYLSGVQQGVSTVIAGAQLGGMDGAGAAALFVAEQLEKAIAMVAEGMGFTKNSGREGPGADASRLIIPG